MPAAVGSPSVQCLPETLGGELGRESVKVWPNNQFKGELPCYWSKQPRGRERKIHCN